MQLSVQLRKVAAFGIATLALLVAACGSSSSSPSTGPSAAAQLNASQCNKTQGITVYSAMGYDADTTTAFQQQTGITTKLVDLSTGELLAKIASEGANPQWDIVWFDGNTTMQDLNNQNYLLKWKSGNISNYTDQGSSLVPTDYAYYPTGVTAAGAIIYNKTNAPAVLPADWSDLLQSQYKGQIGMNDPAFSGPAFPMIAGVSQLQGGESQGKTYFQSLKANGLAIFQTNDPNITAVKTGTKEFGIVQDSAYYGAVANGATNLGIIYPKSGVAELPGEIGISKYSTNAACAEEFVNWMLSSQGQYVSTHHDPTDGDTYYVELIKGVTPVVQRQTNITFFKLDVAKWASVEDELKTWFHSNIVAGS